MKRLFIAVWISTKQINKYEKYPTLKIFLMPGYTIFVLVIVNISSWDVCPQSRIEFLLSFSQTFLYFLNHILQFSALGFLDPFNISCPNSEIDHSIIVFPNPWIWETSSSLDKILIEKIYVGSAGRTKTDCWRN